MEKWEASYVAGIIDGEGSINLTRMHKKEHRRPTITIPSTDKELLVYLQSLIGGIINNKRNYCPDKHKDSYTLSIKKKESVLAILKVIHPYLRIERKIINEYQQVTPRNGKYTLEMLEAKKLFEDRFFHL